MSDRFFSEEQIGALVLMVKVNLASHEVICRRYQLPYEKWFLWWRNFSRWELVPSSEIRRLTEENQRLRQSHRPQPPSLN